MKKIYKPILIILLLLLVSCLSACTEGFSIMIGYKELTMYVGDTMYLTTNAGEDNTVTWKSSDTDVILVDDDGKVEALKVGYAYVSATFGEETSTIYVNVLTKITDNRTLSISGKQMVVIDEPINLMATVELKEGEYVIWTSSDESIAAVTANGLVSGIMPGLVTIKATLSSNNNIYDERTILVRTGSGVQTVVYNYIYTNTYLISGKYDIQSLSDKVVSTVNAKKDAIIGVSNYQKSGFSLSLDSVGSGVIYKKEVVSDGFKYTLLTNYHVIKDADSLKAYIGNDDDIEVDATFIKGDEKLDLAILTFVYTKDITPIDIDFDYKVKAGDFVIAIGNPDGYSFYNSVTFGVASYINRTLSGEKATFIQHDAAINPGNSGGALLDLDGHLIGINTLKIVKTTVEGMGFAIDLDTLRGFME